MKRKALRFWMSAVLAAGGWAVITSFLLPYDALGLDTGADRGRAWLLTLWTSGVMGICFGLAGILGYSAPLGYREVAEAGSLTQAMEARRRAKHARGSLHTNFAWWLTVTGAMLIGIYFLAWGISYA